MEIELWKIKSGVFLIIEDKNSPVEYINQTNGYACSHPGLRGFLVPVEFESDLQNKFCNSAYMGTGHALDSAEFFSDVPNILLQLNKLTDNVYEFILDEEKIKENTESWVHLIGNRLKSDSEFSILFDFPDKIYAILTWPNSD